MGEAQSKYDVGDEWTTYGQFREALRYFPDDALRLEVVTEAAAFNAVSYCVTYTN
jgi:hypothetical protein